jgi:hypothetical protein
MPIARFQMPDGRIGRFEVPEGTTPEQAQAMIAAQVKAQPAPKIEAPAPGFGKQLDTAIRDLPRQVGLTARYGAEGVGDVLDFVTSPIRAGLNAILPNKAPTQADLVTGAAPRQQIEGRSGEVLANLLGLPKPQTAGERVVGDATRLLAGGALPIAGAAGALARTPVAAQTAGRGVLQQLAASPGTQMASAAAAGGAGGYTRETGGGPGAQMIASLGAGIAAPFGVAASQRAASAARQAMTPRTVPPQRIDITINNALRGDGMQLADLPADIAASLRQDVAQAFQMGEKLSPDALRRLADYRFTGLTPTRARLSLDPGEVTRQANLAKAGANLRDPAAQQLAQTQNTNNQALVRNLNELGATGADDILAGGERIMSALESRNDIAKKAIGQAYNAARDTSGRAAMLDPSAFTRRANDLLDDALLGGKLPGDVRNLLNRAATGEMPLTVDVAEQFKTRLGELQRATTDMAERKALGLVRSALDDTPLQQGQEIGQQSVEAFNQARALNRAWMQTVEKTPALQAVRDGMAPDKFVQQFIVGASNKANVRDVEQLARVLKGNDEALVAIKDQITAHLKEKATGGAADEVARFSQSAYNKALNAIGERKLGLFFQPDEVARLKALGRVASYEQVQPVGSAVNNSNTAGAAMGLLERISTAPLLGKIPLIGPALEGPLQNIVVSQQSGAALNAPGALLMNVPRLPAARRPTALTPAALLGTETEEQRRRREAGLLTP